MPNRVRCHRSDCRSERCSANKIFSCLSPEQDSVLGHERLARHYEAGAVVVHSDTPALSVHSINSGQVKLSRLTLRGNQVVVGYRGPGELLGVREVLCARPYQVTIETLEPSVLCAVPREAFLQVVRSSPELAMRLLGELAKDYLMTEEQLVARAHLSVRARTARLLVAMTDGRWNVQRATSSRQISMAREEMALLVGTTRETLSRTLGQLAGRGFVRIENGAVRVLEPGHLARLAE
jgi:CRP/FNR family transcriptional regulator